MCSTHHLIVVYIGVKFRENILTCFRVVEQTRNYEALTDGRTDGRTELGKDTQHFGRCNIIPRHLCGGA